MSHNLEHVDLDVFAPTGELLFVCVCECHGYGDAADPMAEYRATVADILTDFPNVTIVARFYVTPPAHAGAFHAPCLTTEVEYEYGRTQSHKIKGLSAFDTQGGAV